MKKKHGQMSEAFLTTVFLTLSGGFQDAYTYFYRGRVFANAQTGNIVLMSRMFSIGEYREAVRYLVPLLSFICGVFIAEHVRQHYRHMEKIHWRQIIMAAEILILFAVGFLPQEWNSAANAFVSFVCAMQIQTFRKVNGNSYASTMCIGNLRSATENLYQYFHTGNREVLLKSVQYFGVILLFSCGAAAGAYLTARLCERAVWICCVLLFVSFCMMFVREDKNPRKEPDSSFRF